MDILLHPCDVSWHCPFGQSGPEGNSLLPPAFIDLDPASGLPAALLALNNDFAAELSLLDPAKARHLVRHAFMARAIGNDALLIAFDQDAPYDNHNFRWFKERFDRFVY